MKWYSRIVFGIIVLIFILSLPTLLLGATSRYNLIGRIIGFFFWIGIAYFLLRFIDKKLNMPKVLNKELQTEEGKGNQAP